MSKTDNRLSHRVYAVTKNDRVPRRGVTGGGAPRSPAGAGQVSWR
jgi:hypothetical protein